MKTVIKPRWIIPAVILLAGLASAVVRVFGGLGAATNLNDRFPWGLWVGFDVLSGVALAAGAFTLSGAVYVLHLERFRPLVRAAIVTGFIGYLAVIIGLMFDLGRPYRIWHPLVMWNPRSVMFEISWCVTLYTLVLAAEFSAFLFERLRWASAYRIAHGLTIPLVMLGVILSTLHQSSLGSLFLIVPNKLHPLWYTPWLPVFFFLSALAIGCAMVIVESYLSSKAFNMELETDLLADLGRVLVVLLGFYGIARFLDLSARNALASLGTRGFERSMFLAEMLLTVLGPFVLLLIPNARRNRLGLFMGGLMVVGGFILNRFNVGMTGMVRASGTKYVPSMMELSVTFSLLVVAVVLFGLAARYLNIFPMAKPCLETGQTCLDKPTCCLVLPAKLWATAVWTAAVTFLVAGILDFTAYRPVTRTDTVPVHQEARANAYPALPADVTFKRGADSPGAVTFSHQLHVPLVVCADCHTGQYHITAPTFRDNLPSADMHAVAQCGACHDGTKARNECEACHAGSAPGP